MFKGSQGETLGFYTEDMRKRNHLGQYVASSDSIKDTKFDDLPQDFATLFELYEEHGITSLRLNDKNPLVLKLTQNESKGSSRNENYCLLVPGASTYVPATPSTCHDFRTSLVETNRIFYLLCNGMSMTQVAEHEGLVRRKNGRKIVNSAPIRTRLSNFFQFYNDIYYFITFILRKMDSI